MQITINDKSSVLLKTVCLAPSGFHSADSRADDWNSCIRKARANCTHNLMEWNYKHKSNDESILLDRSSWESTGDCDLIFNFQTKSTGTPLYVRELVFDFRSGV